MNIQDLIAELEALADAHPDAEVRLAMQPSWPFEYSIDRVAFVTLDERHGPQPVVYLSEGSQLGYLPGAAARELDWK